MSAVTKHERPGVYSAYEASSLTAAAAGGGSVAVVAAVDGDGLEPYYQWTSYSKAAADVGECALSRMAQAAIRNGAGVVYGIPAGENYDAAFAVMAALEDVGVVACDSAELAVQQALKTAVEECSAARRERIAVVGMSGADTTALTGRAKALNSERMVLVGPDVIASDGKALSGVFAAAAVAAAVAVTRDPAVPLNGTRLPGLGGVGEQYGDNEVDLLVRGGVTPLEALGGVVSPVRGITTRTTTGGAQDITWRELTTILIVDDVVPSIRQSLRSRFSQTKNTVQTRGAIRSQVIVELESKLRAETIDSYGDVSVSVYDQDPTVCLVEFSFAVAHGLNQIYLTAHITI